MDVIAGGLVTLAATFFVQVLVIPRVQARTRNRERWENDVIELRTLVHEELPQAQRELGYAIDAVMVFESHRNDDSYDQGQVEVLIREERERLDSVQERYFSLAFRLSRVEARVSLVDRQNAYWRKLTIARTAYYSTLMDAIEATSQESIMRADLEIALEKLTTALRELEETSRTITETIAPPPRQRIRRFYLRIRRNLDKWKALRRHRDHAAT